MSTEALIEKLRKLRAKALDASLSEEESALYAAKVAELLAAHGLEMSVLEEKDRQDHVVHEMAEMMYADPWRRSLLVATCELYFCFSFGDSWYDEKSGKVRRGRTIVGRPHNIVTAREMYAYLEQTTLRLARDYVQNHDGPFTEYDEYEDDEPREITARAAQIGFERGCGERLASRLRTMKWDMMERKPKDQAVSGLPMLYKTELELSEQYARDKFSLKNARRSGSSINSHGRAGARAADGVGLSPQVATSTKGPLLR